MKRVIFFSGAGLSAESGVPTFRDSGGLWNNHSVDEVCNLENFFSNYTKVNDFYNKRRTDLANVEPNHAHRMIARLQTKYPENVINVTTNVDDLLERAGAISVQYLHGNLTKVVYNYGEDKVSSPVDIGYTAVSDTTLSGNKYPVKPNVVFFGEMAPEYGEYYELCDSLTSKDLVIVIGSSDLVVPFGLNALYGASFSKHLDDRPTNIIRVNPHVIEETSIHPEDNIIAQSYTLQTGTTAVEWFSDKDNIDMIHEHLKDAVNFIKV